MPGVGRNSYKAAMKKAKEMAAKKAANKKSKKPSGLTKKRYKRK